MIPINRLPKGFKTSGVACGIKPEGNPDLALIVSDINASAAGCFTTNRVCAAPVKVTRERVASEEVRAIVINSGNANACTGEQGLSDAKKMASQTAKLLDIPDAGVLVCSTGTIGKLLPMDCVKAGIQKAFDHLTPDSVDAAAAAILTTDTGPKLSERTVVINDTVCRMLGFAKGAGMIEPNMATMLAFIMTDAAIPADLLQEQLRLAVADTFNRISVDGDMSTNDSVLCLANGAAGAEALNSRHAAFPDFVQALTDVCSDLAELIVRDGEGATRLVRVQVKGAVSAGDAEKAARAIAHSFLVKTSWAGDGSQWGRIMDVLGYCGADLREDRIQISYDNLVVVENGLRGPASEDELKTVVQGSEFTLTVDLNLGAGEAGLLTCDCTEEYVRINM